jgi:hypothetical protein
MDTLFEYGLTERSMTAIAFAIITLSLSIWGACRQREARERVASRLPITPLRERLRKAMRDER